MLYYVSIEYVVNLDDQSATDGIFNLWLILPYVTEIILNCVIFYYNFVKEKFGTNTQQTETEDIEEKNEPLIIVPSQNVPEYSTINSGAISK